MQYTDKDYAFLGKQVASGKYMPRSTFFLAVVLALLVGVAFGRYVFPHNSDMPGTAQKRPLGQGTSGIASQMNPNNELLQSIFLHEEDVRKDPSNLEAWEHLGNLYFEAGEPEKSVNAYNKALELNPGNTSVLVDCGIMYRRLEQYEKALEYFDKALQIDPKHQNALFNSGIVLYFDLKRKDDALEFWRRLVRINPDAKNPMGQPVSKMIEELS